MEEINQSEYGVGYAWITYDKGDSMLKPAYKRSVSSNSNYYASVPIEVKEKDQFLITIYQISYSGSTEHYHCPVIITDINKNILRTYRTGSTAELCTFEVAVPPEGKYLLLTTHKDHLSDMKIERLASNLNNGLLQNINNYQFWRKKNVAIIGDSMSTSGTYSIAVNRKGNVPELFIYPEDVGKTLMAYPTKTDVDNEVVIGTQTITAQDLNNIQSFTPTNEDLFKQVGKPANKNSQSLKVWWEYASDILGFNPIPVCWSGSSLTAHEENNDIYKNSWAWHDATINKCGIRIPGTMNRIAPNVIIVCRGANDFSHAPYAIADKSEILSSPGNYFEEQNGEPILTDKKDDEYDIVRAMKLIVYKIREKYPKTQIIFCTMNSFKRVHAEKFPVNNKTSTTEDSYNTIPQYNEIIRQTAKSLGCHIIDFEKDGITFENLEDYTSDNVHPNAEGHKIMAKRALIDLMKINDFE